MMRYVTKALVLDQFNYYPTTAAERVGNPPNKVGSALSSTLPPRSLGIDTGTIRQRVYLLADARPGTVQQHALAFRAQRQKVADFLWFSALPAVHDYHRALAGWQLLDGVLHLLPAL